MAWNPRGESPSLVAGGSGAGEALRQQWDLHTGGGVSSHEGWRRQLGASVERGARGHSRGTRAENLLKDEDAWLQRDPYPSARCLHCK